MARIKGILFVSVCAMLLSHSALAEEIKIQKPEGVVRAPSLLLEDVDGTSKSLGDYSGKVLLIHFWATWCVPCKDELPEIKTLWEKFKDKGFVVVAIAEDSRKAVKPFIAKYGMGFPVLIDQYGGVMRDYGVRMLPTSYLVNRKGNIEGIAIGPRKWDSQEAVNLIQGLLAE